ncbi:MAG: Maf family protein [Thermoleophilia bacterium]
MLASGSPRRSELIAHLGVPFRVVPSGFEEHGPGTDALARVRANATGKARDVAAREGVPDGGAVLGADTEVALDGHTLSKPADEADARRMLTALSGRTHQVLTAVTLITAAGDRCEVAQAQVHVRDITPEVMDWYLATGEWHDRAGAYAIQGSGGALVRDIVGDHTGVVGLPLPLLADMLAQAGLWPPAHAG